MSYFSLCGNNLRIYSGFSLKSERFSPSWWIKHRWCSQQRAVMRHRLLRPPPQGVQSSGTKQSPSRTLKPHPCHPTPAGWNLYPVPPPPQNGTATRWASNVQTWEPRKDISVSDIPFLVPVGSLSSLRAKHMEYQFKTLRGPLTVSTLKSP